MSGLIVRQYKELVLGDKTQTRRVKLPYRLELGAVRAVVPKRGYSAYWLGFLDGEAQIVSNPASFVSQITRHFYPDQNSANHWLARNDFAQVRVQVSSFFEKPLQSISPQEALLEGIKSDFHYAGTAVSLDGAPLANIVVPAPPADAVGQYQTLWNKVNKGKKGLAWEDNPTVWVINFDRTFELRTMVNRFINAGLIDKLREALPTIDYQERMS